jgi:hypothetical protein
MRHELRTEIEAEMTEVATKEISSGKANYLFSKHVDETFGGITIFGNYYPASYVLGQDWHAYTEMRGRWLAVNGYEVTLDDDEDF